MGISRTSFALCAAIIFVVTALCLAGCSSEGGGAAGGGGGAGNGTSSTCHDAWPGRPQRPLTETYDAHCDGTPNWCKKYTYDEHGNVTLTEVEPGCNGTLTPYECTSYVYDAQGNATRINTYDGCGADITACVFKEYDEHGNATKTWTGKIPDCTTKTLEKCMQYEYDTGGRLISSILHWGITPDNVCSSTPNLCTHYTYDERGNMPRQEIDMTCGDTSIESSGSGPWCFDFTCDSAGRVIAEDLHQPSGNGTVCGQSPTDCSTYTY